MTDSNARVGRIGVGPAMTWDDVAEFYGKVTGGHARVKPMDEVAAWLEQYAKDHPDIVYIDPNEETFHLVTQKK